MYNLALAMHDQGKNHDALVLMLWCYELRKDKIGMNHPHTKYTLEFLNLWRSDQPWQITPVANVQPIQ
jgi:hypothetical protein